MSDTPYILDAIPETEVTGIAHGEVAHTSTAGMPQIDPSGFASQLFWLAITFIALYMLISKSALPRIHEVLEKRRHRIAQDLDRAEALAKEADEAKTSYEKLLADAKADANALLSVTQSDMAKEAEAQYAKLDQELSERLDAAAASLSEKREQLRSSLASVSQDVAQAIIQQVSGKTADAATLEKGLKL